MCLGIPGPITEVWREDGAPMARADFAGHARRVCRPESAQTRTWRTGAEPAAAAAS